jgi:Rrf2 family iron-sulfur cluster assembly transcriptional regulator
MLALSHTSGYAVLALTCLAYEAEGWLLARDIAEWSGIPQPYLSKILNSLTASGLVEAKRGYRGGYRLGRPSDEIRVADVVAAVEGADWDEHCLLGLNSCSDDRSCPMHTYWKATRVTIREELERISLCEVAEFEHSLPNNKHGFLPHPPEEHHDA